MVATKLVTADELLAMPDEPFVELIEGVLVEKSDRYASSGWAASKLITRLILFDPDETRFVITASRGGFLLGRDPDTVLAPSLAILTKHQWRALDRDHDGYIPVPPIIAVEATQETDREEIVAKKIGISLAAGVREVWRIRASERWVSIVLADGTERQLSGDATLASELLPGFGLSLPELFDRA